MLYFSTHTHSHSHTLTLHTLTLHTLTLHTHTQPLLGWPFYLPLALCGFHPHAFAAHAQLNVLFMYWIHTDLIDRLPFGLEYVNRTMMLIGCFDLIDRLPIDLEYVIRRIMCDTASYYTRYTPFIHPLLTYIHHITPLTHL